MIFLYITVGAIILALIVKKSVWNPLNTEFKWFYLVFIPFALELFVVLKDPGNFAGIITIAAYLTLAVFCLVNLKIKGFFIISIGELLNSLVVIVNAGKMPVSKNTLILAGLNPNLMDAKHVFMSSKTIFPFLGDVIPINFLNLHYACSVGDLFVYTGLFLLIYLNSQNSREKVKKLDNS
jgi:hypothetical protein